MAKNRVQGEGDYEAAKRFDDAEKAFVKSGKVEEHAGKARPASPEEARALEQAEAAGRARSKGEDQPTTARGTPARNK